MLGAKSKKLYNDQGVIDIYDSKKVVLDNFKDNTPIMCINSTSGIVKITAEVKSITVFNIMGQKVLKTRNNFFNSNVLTIGIYYLNIETGLGNMIKRFIRD